MHPAIALDRSTVAQNARAWRAYAGVPVWAVVKANGYGWGYGTLVRALEGLVDAYCVADADELDELRKHTSARAVVLSNVPRERLREVLRANAAPNIQSEDELLIAQSAARERGEPLRVRVGLRPAAAWSGLSLSELRAFSAALARHGAHVELWSHVTERGASREQIAAFDQAVRLLQNSGVRVAGTDLCSTFPLSAFGANGSAVRIGVGLFGATGGRRIPGVRCALRVAAPITRVERLPAGSKAGYGDYTLAREEAIATARCGYADGLPASLSGYGGVLSVGMQYVTVRAADFGASSGRVALLEQDTDLDALCAHAGRLPHDAVTALGNAACAREALLLRR